jgi:hypothetical protein
MNDAAARVASAAKIVAVVQRFNAVCARHSPNVGQMQDAVLSALCQEFHCDQRRAADEGRTMRAFAFGAVVLAALTSTAEAGKREKCAASVGATGGAAFTACMSAEKAGSNQQQKPLYKDPASRARCRMGNC